MTVANLPREDLDVELALLDDPALPSRSAMDDAKLDELVASIRASGSARADYRRASVRASR